MLSVPEPVFIPLHICLLVSLSFRSSKMGYIRKLKLIPPKRTQPLARDFFPLFIIHLPHMAAKHPHPVHTVVPRRVGCRSMCPSSKLNWHHFVNQLVHHWSMLLTLLPLQPDFVHSPYGSVSKSITSNFDYLRRRYPGHCLSRSVYLI